MLTEFADSVVTLINENIALVEPIVFALGFAESTMVVSLLVPSSALLVAIGGVHSAAGGEFWSVVLAGGAGAFLGDVITFAIGRYFKDDIRKWWPLSRHPEWYAGTRIYVARWGAPGVIFSKFFGVLRPFVPAIAGAAGMKWAVFLTASPVSCVLWAGAFLAPGYGIGLLFT